MVQFCYWDLRQPWLLFTSSVWGVEVLVTFTSEPTGMDMMTSVEDPSGFRRLRLNARSTIPVSRNEAHEFHADVSK